MQDNAVMGADPVSESACGGVKPMYRSIVLLCSLLSLAAAAADAARDSAEVPRPSLIAEAMLPVTFEDGRLGGPGGEALLAAARSAQFVLLGEDHGYAETPNIAAALVQSMGPDGP